VSTLPGTNPAGVDPASGAPLAHPGEMAVSRTGARIRRPGEERGDEEHQMKYMLLTYGDPGPHAATRDPLLRAIPETGEWVAGAPLADPGLACTLRVRDGVAETTDGPIADAREQLMGYWLVDCENLDRALELAALLPGARTAAVEVRPLMDLSGMEM
jgi:hypothetical protein